MIVGPYPTLSMDVKSFNQEVSLMSDCLFCKMVAGDIQPDVVYEDNDVLALRDINPRAPTHILVIPKRHIATLNDLDDSELGGKLLQTVSQLARQLELSEDGYRVVINCNENGGQEVFHLHLHLLGGRQLTWPPG